MNIEYLPLLCEFPLVSVFSAIRMYSTHNQARDQLVYY